MSNAKLQQKSATLTQTNILGPGGSKVVSNDITSRLIALLSKISEYSTPRKIDLFNILSRHELPGGLINYDQFLTDLKQ